MTAKIILNPYAARWKARSRWERAEAALNAAGVDFEMVASGGRGDCLKLAMQAVQGGFSPIISAGGDGTISEVINGMARAADPARESLATFGLLPLGTANDLANNLNLPLDFDEMARIIATGHTRPLDLCQVNERYFVNNAALGLEPTVTVIQKDIQFLKGIPRYLYAALKGIWRNQQWDVEMSWDDGEYNGPMTLISVGNGAITGGLFYMAPHAVPFDGKLTVVYGHRASRRALLRLLPRAMKAEGSYLEEDDIYEIDTTQLSVKLKQPSPAHADGELFCDTLTEAHFQIYPGRVPMLMP